APKQLKSRRYAAWQLGVGNWKLTEADLLVRGLRNLQHLPGLDLVRIAQLVLVRVEDVHVGIRVAEHVLRDLAERIARLHRVSSLALSTGGRTRLSRSGGLDIGDHFLLPGRNGLDGIPN